MTLMTRREDLDTLPTMQAVLGAPPVDNYTVLKVVPKTSMVDDGQLRVRARASAANRSAQLY